MTAPKDKLPAVGNLRARFRALCEGTRALIEHDPRVEMSRMRRLAARYVRVIWLTARWQVYDQIKLHAQALTYDTVLAIVPLLAVVFAIFRAFGAAGEMDANIRERIVENVSGSPELQAAISQYLEQFVGNVSAGHIGTVSILLLVYSVLSLLGHIEVAFNAIFGATQQRPLVTRMLTYWAVLTFGPLALLASFALTTALHTTRVGAFVGSLSTVSGVLMMLAPLFVTWVGFTVMYWFVPNTRVRVTAAIFAALLAGSSWNIAKAGYAYYARNAITLQNIYGSLAVIPLFIFWIYVSWLIVLFGAQLAYAFQNARTYRREDEMTHASHHFMERAACRVLLEVGRDFVTGQPATDQDSLSQRLQIPRRILDALLGRLRQGGMLQFTEPDGRLVPGHDLTHLTVAQVVELLRSSAEPEPSLRQDEAAHYFEGLFASLDHERTRLMGQITFRELAERLPAALPAPENPEET